MARGRSPSVGYSALRVEIFKALESGGPMCWLEECGMAVSAQRSSSRRIHWTIPWHGCVPAVPASVSSGKLVVAPPRPTIANLQFGIWEPSGKKGQTAIGKRRGTSEHIGETFVRGRCRPNSGTTTSSESFRNRGQPTSERAIPNAYLSSHRSIHYQWRPGQLHPIRARPDPGPFPLVEKSHHLPCRCKGNQQPALRANRKARPPFL